jgi:AraC family transcriptional regulator, regulatory protein of adaptative response / methylphosphotriester-DNA alkyltransferase methyltransferase
MVGYWGMRPSTTEQRRRLYLQARVVVARHYRRPLTLEGVARALASSPRQLTRVYAQFGEVTFREDLLARRLNVAAQLLIEQPAIPVRDIARLVGFRQAPHFARVFRRRYGLTPASFRAEARAYARNKRRHSQPGLSTSPEPEPTRARALQPVA